MKKKMMIAQKSTSLMTNNSNDPLHHLHQDLVLLDQILEEENQSNCHKRRLVEVMFRILKK